MIKVADFGLSESTYTKTYLRVKEGSGIKLPIKWMSPESLTDGVFSEKTDVVCDRRGDVCGCVYHCTVCGILYI